MPRKAIKKSPKEKRIAELIRELEGKSETAQREIIDQLVKMGASAIKPLASALQNGATYQVRMAAAVALGEIRNDRCVKPLVAGLADTSLNVQRMAAQGLVQIGSAAVDALMKSLDSPDDSVRRWAAEVLGKIGKKTVATKLVEKLPLETPEVQKAIIIALGELASRKATHPLVSILRGDNVDLTRYAAEALGRLGDAEGIESLIECLDSPSIDVRKAATEALVRVGPESVPALTHALQHNNYVVRRWVAEALGNLKDKRAVKHLIHALHDENVRVRRYAALALGEIGARNATPHLQSLLQDENQDVRYSAVKAVASIGGKEALSGLVTALKDNDWAVRMTAAQGLGDLGDREGVAPLCEALRDPEWSVRYHAAAALGQIGDVAALISADLRITEGRGRQVIRRQVSEAICDVAALIPLIRTAGDSNAAVRRHVAEALGKLGDERALPALERLVRDSDHAVAAAADEAIAPLRRRSNGRRRRNM